MAQTLENFMKMSLGFVVLFYCSNVSNLRSCVCQLPLKLLFLHWKTQELPGGFDWWDMTQPSPKQSYATATDHIFRLMWCQCLGLEMVMSGWWYNNRQWSKSFSLPFENRELIAFHVLFPLEQTEQEPINIGMTNRDQHKDDHTSPRDMNGMVWLSFAFILVLDM